MFIEVSFTDYLGQPLQGIRSIVEVETTGSEYQVTTNAALHPFAKFTTDNHLNAYWVIEGNKMKAYGGTTTGSQVVAEVYKFMLKNLQTSDKEYTKFKFIQ